MTGAGSIWVRTRWNWCAAASKNDCGHCVCRILRPTAGCCILRDGDEELTSLLDVISTNVTEFFREWRHFEYLQSHVLPEWRKRPDRKNFQVWSAACSSGEEAYSLAILLAEFFNDSPPGAWHVTGTDLSTRMLATAKQAVYRADRVKLPQPDWLRRHFQKGVGSFDGYFRLKSSVRDHVDFQHLNLIQSCYPLATKFDVIFCRNVMIYFDRKTQAELVPRLIEHLLPGGYLLVGHSESLAGIEQGLKTIRPGIYQHA